MKHTVKEFLIEYEGLLKVLGNVAEGIEISKVQIEEEIEA